MVAGDALHERLIDLEYIERQAFQIREAGIAGAEVVDRDPDPMLLELAQRGDGELGILRDRALGQLDLEPRRIDAGLVHHLDDALDQIGLLELARGHIDADVQVEPGIAPAAQLGARGAQDPLAERHDEPGLLRERDEARGLDQAQFRVTPTDQRFGATHPVSREIDLRLIVQYQFAALRGPLRATCARGFRDRSTGEKSDSRHRLRSWRRAARHRHT